MKEVITFQIGKVEVTTKIHKVLGKVARLPGWGWYAVDESNVAYKAVGMRLPKPAH